MGDGERYIMLGELVNLTGHPIVTSHGTICPHSAGALADVAERGKMVQLSQLRILDVPSSGSLTFADIERWMWSKTPYDYAIVQESVLEGISEEDLLTPFPIGPNRPPKYAIRWYTQILTPAVALKNGEYRTDEFRCRYLGRMVSTE